MFGMSYNISVVFIIFMEVFYLRIVLFYLKCEGAMACQTRIQ